VDMSPDVFLVVPASVDSAEDFLDSKELRELVFASGVELLVGLLIPEIPEADVRLDTEVMERRRAAIAELGGLTVFSVKRVRFRVAGAAGDITSEESRFAFRVDNASELRLLALLVLSFLLPTTEEATERTELGRGGGGPMGVLP